MDTTDVVLASWLARPGDAIRKGQGVAEVETEKVTVVIESEYSGTLVEILQPVGATVPVGDPICRLQAS